MREAYQVVEAPLIAKMAKSQASSMVASADALHEDVKESQLSAGTEEASMDLYTQAPYMTQIPTQEPATQAFLDTQSPIFTSSTADEQQQQAELSLPSQQAAEVFLPSAISTVDETLELPAPSPVVLPPSTQEFLPLSIEEEDPARIIFLTHEVSPKEISLQLKSETKIISVEEAISPENGVDTIITKEDDDSLEKEENTDAKLADVDEDGKEVKPADKDEESQIESFQPATQMPFVNDQLEFEEDSLPEASAVDEPILPSMSTGISIQKDEPEESSAVEKEKSSESEEGEGQFITKVPFQFFSRLLKYCDEDPIDFFTAPEETIDRLYESYERFKEERESDTVLPCLESLLPRESSPIRPVSKKRVVFESEVDFEEPPGASDAAARLPILKKARKSMLLPNDSSKKVDWDSLTPSSPSNENRSPEPPNSTGDEYTRLKQKQAKGRRPFTEEETANLVDGVRKYGRKWKVIQTCYKFNDRTPVDLKDKARNLARNGIITLPAARDR